MKKYSNNRCLPLLICLFYAYIFRDFIIDYFFGFKYFDELVAILGLTTFAMHVMRHTKLSQVSKGAVYSILAFCLFILAGVAGNLIYNYQPFFSAALPDIFVCTKFWGWLAAGYFLSIHVPIEKVKDELSRHARIVTVVLFVLTVYDVLFHVWESDIKMGMRSVGLFYGHDGFAGTACVLLCLIWAEKGQKRRNLFAALNLLMMLSTLRYKAIGASGVFVVLILCQKIKKSKIKLWQIILLFLTAVGLAKRQIFMLIEYSMTTARPQLYIQGLHILKDYFPIGTGFGTYASYFSKVHYSMVYNMYGLNNIYGLSPEKSSFINDTFWPMVFGQTGILGLIGYCYILYWVFRRIQKIAVYDFTLYQSGLYALAYILIESTSASAFLHWNMLFIGIWLGIVLRVSKNLSLKPTARVFKKNEI